MTVKIDSFVVGVVLTGFNFLSDFSRNAVCPSGQYVANAGAFATFVPAAFNLVRRNRAALLTLPALGLGIGCALPLYLFIRSRRIV